MNKPILLTNKELVKPIEQALERIEAIRKKKLENEDSIILEGLFALAVASFEHSLNDTLKVLLTHIPDKLDVKTEPISKEELINGEPLKYAIENKVRSIGYKNLPDIINYFLKTIDIADNTVSESEINYLLEIKATRNLLIHNNLIINNTYKDTAGPNIRTIHSQGRLLIDQDYLYQSLVTIRTVLENIKNKLYMKYKKFTKINATKNLFEYIFKTPVMKFENEFILNNQADVVCGIKQETTQIESLSTSERFFFDMWLAHSHSKSFEFQRGIIYHLDSSNRKKIEYLLSALDLLKS